jgi:ribosome-associated toxin RatA of RatAB toxin-antitoxin module
VDAGPKRTVSILVGFLLLVRASVAATGNSDWTSAGTKDGVTLAFRDDPVLAAREVRATSELPFPAALIFSVVCDLTHYNELVPGVTEATLLEGTSPTEYEVYLRYAPRFVVVAARDVVLRVRGGADAPGTFGCSWSEVADRLAERKGTVRMPLLRGTWTLETLDGRRSRVAYQLAADPGGRIPGWLVRKGAVQAMPEVIENVRQRLGRLHEAAPPADSSYFFRRGASRPSSEICPCGSASSSHLHFRPGTITVGFSCLCLPKYSVRGVH